MREPSRAPFPGGCQGKALTGGCIGDHTVSYNGEGMVRQQPPAPLREAPPWKGGTRVLALLLTLLLLVGCASPAVVPRQKQFEASFLDVFDTVTYIKGRAASQEEFAAAAQAIHGELMEYHRLFDIYNDYEGLNNLKTVNDQAGVAPVEADEKILNLLEDCVDYYGLTETKVNVAMGPVLYLWHEAREEGFHDPANASLPDQGALEAASLHTALEALVLDRGASTVYLTDPQARLDVGAIAKGWAVRQVAEAAPEGFLISVGGNVCATGPKDEKGAPWKVGVQDPANPNQYLHTLSITTGSVVTSGSYQRAYAVDGRLYHHIIDPVTLFPSEYWASVTVVCRDSGLADALSTALFLLPQAEGQAILDKTDAVAMWVDPQGQITYSPGFEDLILR